MPEEFDLRKLNPSRGDLVLLIDDDFETGNSPLLAVFDRFFDKRETNIFGDGPNVNISSPGAGCSFSTDAAFYLLNPEHINGTSIQLPKFNRCIVSEGDIRYCADRGYVGDRQVVEALENEKGYEFYGAWLRSQLFPSQEK